MSIATEPIGSIPRPPELIDALRLFAAGEMSRGQLDAIEEHALRDTIRRFEGTESPVITDGEQLKSSFATYPLEGLDNLAPDGVVIPFADGHTRQLPVLTAGPFRYGVHAATYLKRAQCHATHPLKQAVIAPSALSLIYPQDGLPGYPLDTFLADLVDEAEADVRECLDLDAYKVQLDFTEGRLAIKLDPTKQLLKSFIDLNNTLLTRFSDSERQRLGVHTCPGGDRDSTHSLDVDYVELLPDLFRLKVGSFYIQLASEADPGRVLASIAEHAPPWARVFVGVIDPIAPRVESPEEVAERVVAAAQHLPIEQLGTCDDCGFSPFCDDTSTTRDIAFEKIRSRVLGTHMAAEELGV